MKILYLIIIPIVFFFYFKKKNIFKSTILFFILLIFFMIILKENLSFNFNIKKNIPIILMIDASRSFYNNVEITRNWLKYFDEVYYFSDTLSKNTNSLKTEFTSIYSSIEILKEKFKNNVKIVVFSDLQNNYMQKYIDSYNVYFIYKEKITTNKIFIYDINIEENIFSGEPFDVELKVFSKTNINTIFYIKDNKNIIYKDNITLKKGINIVKKVFTFDFKGFKNLIFGIAESEIERLIHFSKESYNIFLATGYPNEEFIFLKRFLEEFKWLSIESQILLNPTDRVKLRKIYSGHIFINLNPEQTSEEIKKLSNSIFIFTEKNKLLTILTNKSLKEHKKVEDGNIYILSNNIRIIDGINSWKIKLKKAILTDLSENFYVKYWYDNLKDFFTEKKSFSEKYNYILNEPSQFDTSKTGIFEIDKIKYQVHLNEKEDFIPISEEDTNNLNIFNLTEINVEKFVKNLKSESKIIQNIKFSINFSENLIVLIILLILLFIFWFYNKF
ncbi:MAG: hypothetical protein N2258_06970 [Brevinematales bacterium]|nr:hypothetical protein [Brevinematales bacterium]